MKETKTFIQWFEYLRMEQAKPKIREMLDNWKVNQRYYLTIGEKGDSHYAKYINNVKQP